MGGRPVTHLAGFKKTIVGRVMNAAVLRTLLLLDIIAMALLSFFYLRGRDLSWHAYLSYGLIALLVPLLGPFLVILTRPGKPVTHPKSWVAAGKRLLPSKRRRIRDR